MPASPREPILARVKKLLLSLLLATAAFGEPLHYLVAYDSALQGDWSITKWDDPDHFIEVDPNAPAPGRPGNAIAVRYSKNGWGGFGLANMTDWNNVHPMYLNEFRTIEFDLYIEPDATGMEDLYFILDDVGGCSEPPLVNFISGWDPEHPENSAGRWIPVTIDLQQIGATIPQFMRFLFYNSGSSRPHFHMANVRLGWQEDTTPPLFPSVSATPNLTYDRLTIAFTNDKATTYKVEYGIGDYSNVLNGDPAELRTTHSAELTGLSRGNPYQYRITATAHPSSSTPPPPGVYEGMYTMPAVPTAPPVISAFEATPAEIPAGESSRLTWAVSDYDSLTIDPAVGSVAQIPGATGVLVRPADTTEYTITATNAIGTVTRTVTVVTHAVPTINKFTTTPIGETSLLTWNVDAFDTLSIDHGVGVVTGISGETGIPVNPDQTTTYVLTASNAYGTVRQTATVIVAPRTSDDVWIMGYYVGYHRSLQTPEQVDYQAMTHVIVGAAVPRTDGTFETHFYIGDTDGPLWAKEVVQRAHAAGTKALLMIGGAGSVNGFLATSDPAVRAAFVGNLKAFVQEYGFDGIDVDWEPLGPSDRTTALALMEALQAPDALPRSAYVYTLPVGWNNMNWGNMADPFFGEIAAYFDRVSPMSYSMFWIGDGWDSWHSSALFGETPNAPSSIDNTVQALRAAGVPDAKIGIGIGFYGSAFENGGWVSSGQSSTGWTHRDPPDIPAYVTEPHQSTDTAFNRYGDNALSYSNIMQYLYSGLAYRWDDTAKVPYLSWSTPASFQVPGYFDDLKTTFVTYDDEQAIAEKGAYVRNNGLGGVMIWAISEGYLGNWKTTGELDPLMKAVKTALKP